MAFPRTIRNYNAFIDGFGWFGRVVEAQVPMLKLATEEFRGGGMDAPIEQDMGLEAMSTEISFAEHNMNLMTLLGKTEERLVLRPYGRAEDYNDVDTYIYTCGGLWKEVDFDRLKTKDQINLKLTCALRYYRAQVNDQEAWEIDVENGKRVIGGEDQLLAASRAMGL